MVRYYGPVLSWIAKIPLRFQNAVRAMPVLLEFRIGLGGKRDWMSERPCTILGDPKWANWRQHGGENWFPAARKAPGKSGLRANEESISRGALGPFALAPAVPRPRCLSATAD